MLFCEFQPTIQKREDDLATPEKAVKKTLYTHKHKPRHSHQQKTKTDTHTHLYFDYGKCCLHSVGSQSLVGVWRAVK